MTSDAYERIYDVIRRIPRGKVATYGQIAYLAELGKQPRMVGYALHAADDDLPWHRVINARGEISARSNPTGWAESRQHRLLVAEGIEFDGRGRVSLTRYRWDP